jgi:hypothetical protein
MIGGDLPSSDPATIALFTNPEVLAIHANATSSREVFREDGLVLWTADDAQGTRWVAAFNLASEPRSIALDARNVGLPVSDAGTFPGRLTELWTNRDVTTTPVTEQSNRARGVAPGSAALHIDIDAHGVRLMRFDSMH